MDNKEMLFEGIEIPVIKCDYYIGIDTYEKLSSTYCLGRKVNEVVEILLSKTITNEVQFKEEVENLSKYFNATILGTF